MSEARTVKGLILQINLGDKEERFLAQDLLVAKFQDLEKENTLLNRKLEIAKEYLAANLDRETFEKVFKELGE